MARIVLGVLFVAAAVLLGGCGSECSQSGSACGRATFNCPYDVYIYARGPDLSVTLTVSACLDGNCESVDNPPDGTGAQSGFLGVGVEAGALVVTLAGSKSDEGKTWSLRVVDGQGNVVVHASGTVHHAANPGGCPNAQQVTLS